MNRRALSYYVIAVAMAVVWLLLVHLPGASEQATLQAQIADAQTQLEDFDQTVLQLPAFIKTRQDLVSFREQLQSKLFAKNELLKLFAQFEKDSKDYGLRLDEIAPPIEELLELNGASSDQPHFLNITLKMTGHYLELGKYVEHLEGEPFFRGINNCRISSGENDRKGLTISLGVRTLLYNGRGAA
jgi:Tfp pilus assembly protein PilO